MKPSHTAASVHTQTVANATKLQPLPLSMLAVQGFPSFKKMHTMHRSVAHSALDTHTLVKGVTLTHSQDTRRSLTHSTEDRQRRVRWSSTQHSRTPHRVIHENTLHHTREEHSVFRTSNIKCSHSSTTTAQARASAEKKKKDGIMPAETENQKHSRYLKSARTPHATPAQIRSIRPTLTQTQLPNAQDTLA